MSSELLDIEVDKYNKSIHIEMMASADIFINIVDEDLSQVAYHITPDQKGIHKANKIIESLSDWTDFVKERNHLQ